MKNSNFHILTQIVGTRNTPDEAYRVLHFELEAQEHALAHARAGVFKTAASRLSLERKAKSWSPTTRMQALGDLAELTADINRVNLATARAEDEIAFIKKLMAEISPHRKYAHLPQSEAFQACQAEEWAAEHLKRAARFLICDGRIPENYLEAMTVHPWWASYILPRIGELIQMQANKTLGLHMLNAERPGFLLALEASHSELTIPAAITEAPALLPEPKGHHAALT